MITARGRAAAALALAALCLAGPASGRATVADGPGWTTWGNSPVRKSRASSSLLTIATARGLRLAWSRPLGGVGAAQPLYLSHIAIGGERRDIYLAVSESGRVSAFDAVAGKTLWTSELGSLVKVVPKCRMAFLG